MRSQFVHFFLLLSCGLSFQIGPGVVRANDIGSKNLESVLMKTTDVMENHRVWVAANLNRVLKLKNGGSAGVISVDASGGDAIFVSAAHALVFADYVTSQANVLGQEITASIRTSLQLDIEGVEVRVFYAPPRPTYKDINNIMIEEDFLFGELLARQAEMVWRLDAGSNNQFGIVVKEQTVLGMGFPVDMETRKQSDVPFYNIGKVLPDKEVWRRTKSWEHRRYNPEYEFVVAAKATNGMSGGPVFDDKNRIVGIINRAGIFNDGQPYYRAIRVDVAIRKALERLDASSNFFEASQLSQRQMNQACERALSAN